MKPNSIETESINEDSLNKSKTSKAFRGRILIVVAALLWSSGGFFAKAPVFNDWPLDSRGGLLAFWRAAFASIVLICLVRKIQWTWKLIPTTLAFAVMNWTFMNALVHCEATLAIWMQYTAPAWVFLFGYVVLKDKPTRQDWVMLTFATVGIAIILSAEIGGTGKLGLLFGLGAGFTFATVVLTLRWMRGYDAIWIIFMNHAVTCLVFSPVMLQKQIYPEGQQWIYLLGFGALQIGLPYILFTRGLKTVSSPEASGIALLEPVLLPLWVFAAWHSAPDYQPPAWTTITGGLLILIGLVQRYRATPDVA